MRTHITDERTGIEYTLHGDYYIPNLVLVDEKEEPVGMWGQRHLWYIQQHKRIFYLNLLMSGGLNRYLSDLDEQAEERFTWLIKQMMKKEGITEKLKEDDQMLWVGKATAIRNCAMEIVNSELIYT